MANLDDDKLGKDLEDESATKESGAALEDGEEDAEDAEGLDSFEIEEDLNE